MRRSAAEGDQERARKFVEDELGAVFSSRPYF
jgi:hypothetical protein